MEKKNFIEKLREELEMQLRKSCNGVTVKLKYNARRMYVIFPSDRPFVNFIDLDIISESGKVMWVNLEEDHLEVEVKPFYSE